MLFFLNLPCLFSYSQDLIYWDSVGKLQWVDFEGKPSGNNEWSAVSHVAVEVKNCPNNGLPNFFVVAWFDKKESWTRNTTLALLSHEQIHFDIRELCARRIRFSIDSLHQLKVKNFKVYTDQIQHLIARGDSEEDLYDEQTNHGKNFIAQKEWSEKICKELERLKKYLFVPCPNHANNRN